MMSTSPSARCSRRRSRLLYPNLTPPPCHLLQAIFHPLPHPSRLFRATWRGIAPDKLPVVSLERAVSVALQKIALLLGQLFAKPQPYECPTIASAASSCVVILLGR